MRCAHVTISGDVHGVGFRSYVKKSAGMLGLAGWVRNRADRKVEAVFEGDKKAVEQMIELCRKGPEFSRVDSVDVVWRRPEGLKGFEVRL